MQPAAKLTFPTEVLAAMPNLPHLEIDGGLKVDGHGNVLEVGPSINITINEHQYL